MMWRGIKKGKVLTDEEMGLLRFDLSLRNLIK